MSEPIFSIRIDDQGKAHTKVTLFNRGGLAGQMTILSADVDEFLRRLVEPSPAIQQDEDRLPGYLGESESIRAQAYQIDAKVAAGMTCRECGKTGLIYEPYFVGHIYHAVAYCLKCGTDWEF